MRRPPTPVKGLKVLIIKCRGRSLRVANAWHSEITTVSTDTFRVSGVDGTFESFPRWYMAGTAQDDFTYAVPADSPEAASALERLETR